jgi:hypothetical protein
MLWLYVITHRRELIVQEKSKEVFLLKKKELSPQKGYNKKLHQQTAPR